MFRNVTSILIIVLSSLSTIKASDQLLNNSSTDTKSNILNYLTNAGVEVDIEYKGEMWNISKGQTYKDLVYVDNFDLVFGFDMGEIAGLTDGIFAIYILGNNGYEPNDYVGTAHGITNIAAPQTWKIYTMFYEQMLMNDN